MPRYFRGGGSLIPQRSEVRFDKATGLLKTTRGISVYDRSDHPNLARFGGPYEILSMPPELKVVQIGQDPSHHEIVPAAAITWDGYQDFIQQIAIDPV